MGDTNQIKLGGVLRALKITNWIIGLKSIVYGACVFVSMECVRDYGERLTSALYAAMSCAVRLLIAPKIQA